MEHKNLQEKKDIKKSSMIDSFFWWKIDKEEVKKEAEDYESLKILDSAKGIASLLLIGSLILTVFVSFFGVLPVEDAIFGVIVYLPIIFFVYKGNRLAIIVMMIFWTIERFVSPFIAASTNFEFYRLMISLVWWAAVMAPLYSAFRVEQLRKKIKKQSKEVIANDISNHHNIQEEHPQEHPQELPKEHPHKPKGSKILKMTFLFVGVLLLISSAVLAFYWFQIRPAQIKHDCSWVKKHEDAVAEKPGMTMEELQANNILKDCSNLPSYSGGVIAPLYNSFDCNRENVLVTDKYLKVPGKPAKDWVEKATDEEYKFCLHDKGL